MKRVTRTRPAGKPPVQQHIDHYLLVRVSVYPGARVDRFDIGQLFRAGLVVGRDKLNEQLGDMLVFTEVVHPTRAEAERIGGSGERIEL